MKLFSNENGAIEVILYKLPPPVYLFYCEASHTGEKLIDMFIIWFDLVLQVRSYLGFVMITCTFFPKYITLKIFVFRYIKIVVGVWNYYDSKCVCVAFWFTRQTSSDILRLLASGVGFIYSPRRHDPPFWESARQLI